MPFSPQPRKKGVQGGPQAGDKPACGHPVSRKDCAVCNPKQAKIIDLNTEKQQISRLRDKISDKATTDKRFSDKASIILSGWINSTKKKK